MANTPQQTGASRHLKIIGALMLVATVVFVGTRLDSFKAKMSDMASVTEGRDAASNLTAPDSLLAYVLRHPEQASLVVFNTASPSGGLFVQEDAPRPVTALPTLFLAARYAEAVAAGQLDRDEVVPYTDIEVFTLPAIEGDRHQITFAQLGLADTLIVQENGRPEEVVSMQAEIPLHQVVEAALQYGDRPSTDYLTLRFDRRGMREVARRAGHRMLGLPLPKSGLYLAWTPPYRGTTAQERLDGFLALNEAQQADTAFAVAERLRDDEAFRTRERDRLRFESLGMTVEQQRAATSSFPKGTARVYAELLADLANGTFVSHSVSAQMHRMLGNPVALFAPIVAETETRGNGGGFTGLYSIGAYARRSDGSSRVAVLLMQDVPTAVFIEMGRQALDQGLIAGLLGSDAFFAHAKSMAENALQH